MHIRPLTIEELPQCIPFGQAFHQEMQLPGRFLPEEFLKNWTFFLQHYTAVILTLWKDETLAGGLGGMVTPDLLDGRLLATEFFWFMDPAHRTGTGAIRLLHAYEAWAKEKGATEVRMVHLVGNHDDQLGRIYQKLGYGLIELNYRKPLDG